MCPVEFLKFGRPANSNLFCGSFKYCCPTVWCRILSQWKVSLVNCAYFPTIPRKRNESEKEETKKFFIFMFKTWQRCAKRVVRRHAWKEENIFASVAQEIRIEIGIFSLSARSFIFNSKTLNMCDSLRNFAREFACSPGISLGRIVVGV